MPERLTDKPNQHSSKGPVNKVTGRTGALIQFKGAEDMTANIVTPATEGDTELIENYAASCVSGNE